MPQLDIFVGTYSMPSPWAGAATAHGRGIVRASVDLSTGRMHDSGRSWDAPDPAFLITSREQRRLWAITEIEAEGSLLSWAVDDRGELVEPSSVPTGAIGPGHLTVDAARSVAYVCHFHGGALTLVALDPRGVPQGVIGRHVLPDDPHGGIRQAEPSRPHCSALVGRDHLLVTDFGRDTVSLFRLHGAGEHATAERVDSLMLPVGTAPRHVAFGRNARIAYISNEKGAGISTVAVSSGRRPRLALVSITPSPGLGRAVPITSEIAAHPRLPLIYLANRRDDSISLFESLDRAGELVQLEATDTRGSWPRHFALSPDARLMIVGDQDSDALQSYFVDDDGRLEWTGNTLELASPACIRFW